MKEWGKVFTTESVLSILAGRKTQTREVISDHNSIGNFKASELLLDQAWVDTGPSPAGNAGPYLHAPVNAPEIEKRLKWKPGDCDPDVIERLYPRIQVGDVLWVKETCRYDANAPSSAVEYKADGYVRPGLGHPEYLGWRSAFRMPRWASRITLEVTEVRVQRVQEISEEDARVEGIRMLSDEIGGITGRKTLDSRKGFTRVTLWLTAREAYGNVWNSINGKKYPWQNNDWVWAISFKDK